MPLARPEDLTRLTPDDFQRLALDLRAAEQGQVVRALDLGYGVTDNGFDGVWEQDAAGASWRIEVKANLSWDNLRKDVRLHLKKYVDRPTLVVCRLALTEAQREFSLRSSRESSRMLRFTTR